MRRSVGMHCKKLSSGYKTCISRREVDCRPTQLGYEHSQDHVWERWTSALQREKQWSVPRRCLACS